MGLIGISGKIGSGKDTVGKIIQYLSLDKVVFSMTTESVVADVTLGNGYCCSKSDWQIKKFAGKLKECVSIITGDSVEQLEEVSVKDRIIFMRPMKDNPTLFESMTVRQLLQELGTEVGRTISPNLWVDALMKDYKAHPYSFYPGYYGHICKLCSARFMADKHQSVCEPCSQKILFPNWIITDMRFPNDLKAVKDREGITIRVNRPCTTCGTYEGKYCSNPYHLRNKHESETVLDTTEFDYTIANNGTVEDLVEKVREILIKEKLL